MLDNPNNDGLEILKKEENTKSQQKSSNSNIKKDFFHKINYSCINLKTNKKQSKIKKKKYNDKNVDYDLYSESLEKINSIKIKLSNTCTFVCRMAEANGELKGVTYSMPVISLCMKLKNGGVNEFTFPLNLAQNLKTALEISIDANKEFFNKSPSKKLIS